MPVKHSASGRNQVLQIAWCVMLPAFLLASLANAQLHAVPITDATPDYVLEGYRVVPPPGNNWFEMHRDKQQALFGKKIESPTHSFVATATSTRITEAFETREQFQDYVNKMRTADPEEKRYREIEFDSAPDETFAAWCVRYRFKRADRGTVPSRPQTLVLEDIGVTCLHPEKKQIVVDVGYTERGRAAELSADLRKEGEHFIRSLQFTAP
jgi:hypothetical protein